MCSRVRIKDSSSQRYPYHYGPRTWSLSSWHGEIKSRTQKILWRKSQSFHFIIQWSQNRRKYWWHGSEISSWSWLLNDKILSNSSHLLFRTLNGWPYHQKRTSQTSKIQKVFSCLYHTLKSSSRISLFNFNCGWCWSLVYKHNEKMYINRTVDYARQWRSEINFSLQIIKRTRTVLVQKISFPWISSRSLCTILLSSNSKTWGKCLGFQKTGEQRNDILQNGGKPSRWFYWWSHPNQRQLLQPWAVHIYLFRNLDNLIGRAAHISFINSTEMLRTLVIAGPHYFFWVFISIVHHILPIKFYNYHHPLPYSFRNFLSFLWRFSNSSLAVCASGIFY